MKNHICKSVACISLSSMLMAAAGRASDCFNSELSHFAGNAVIASGTAIVVNKYCPKVKRPVLTGFILSTSVAVLGECASLATGGRFSVLDVAAGTLGAAAGAYATDKWYITPKASTQNGESTYGVMVSRRF